jgi:broad specificity phosphatase PhoE
LKEKIFYLARHGQTDWNARGRWQGQTDVPLNEAGRGEARQLAASLRSFGIRSIGSSDLARALETAEIVGAAVGLSVSVRDAAFRERSYGSFEGKTAGECRTQDPIAWASFDRDPDAILPGVETISALEQRMWRGLETAARCMETPALIVSHGRSIRALVRRVTEKMVAPIPNAGVYAFRLEGELAVAAYVVPLP